MVNIELNQFEIFFKFKYSPYRLVGELTEIIDINITGTFLWSILTMSSTLLMVQRELVEYQIAKTNLY